MSSIPSVPELALALELALAFELTLACELASALELASVAHALAFELALALGRHSCPLSTCLEAKQRAPMGFLHSASDLSSPELLLCPL